MNTVTRMMKGETMQAVRIKQLVTQEGIMIPLDTVQRFQGKRVDIIILPDLEAEPSPRPGTLSLKAALAEVFEQYHDVNPYQQIDPVQWEREIRNAW